MVVLHRVVHGDVGLQVGFADIGRRIVLGFLCVRMETGSKDPQGQSNERQQKGTDVKAHFPRNEARDPVSLRRQCQAKDTDLNARHPQVRHSSLRYVRRANRRRNRQHPRESKLIAPLGCPLPGSIHARGGEASPLVRCLVPLPAVNAARAEICKEVAGKPGPTHAAYSRSFGCGPPRCQAGA